MKPTPEQEEWTRLWLADRVWTIQTADFAPAQPKAIRQDIDSGMDFRVLYKEYGFRPDGFGMSASFYEVNKKRERAS
jgi:hypothetical protein